jgi:tRNA (guanine10-N2)-dimethyltransferase
MKIIFELSKEYPFLPLAEALCSIKAEKIEHQLIETNEDVAIVDIKNSNPENLANRIALSFFIDEFLFSCDPKIEKIKERARNVDLPKRVNETFRVRCNNRMKSKKINSLELERETGKIFAKNYKVDLEKPVFEVRMILTESKCYSGIKLFEINRKEFESRKAQHRPFFSPISLHPRLARALVNISEIGKGETLLDPFCGTGGILIEAGLIKTRVIGSDISKKMIDGCRKNLEYYGIENYELYQCDVEGITNYIGEVDAVVTDFPYGRSTSTSGEKIETLYERGVETIAKVLKRNKKAVIGLPSNSSLSICDRYLERVAVYPCRVHKSLTRYFGVYKKI